MYAGLSPKKISAAMVGRSVAPGERATSPSARSDRREQQAQAYHRHFETAVGQSRQRPRMLHAES
jgi:hypothetical protein